MAEPDGGAERPSVSWFALALVGLLVLSLRVLHLGYALHSPLTYQPGPDEDFYLHFGRMLASGGTETAVEGSMDPAYGYLLAAVFGLFGPGLFGVYLLQIGLDTVTAMGIYWLGREFGRPRAGLIAAAIYGLTSTAILMTTAALKEIWVANFMVLWVGLALILLVRPRPLVWASLGLLCGMGVALRSNLLLMTPMAVILLPWILHRQNRPWAEIVRGLAGLAIGVLLPLILLSMRNERLAGSFSPVPTQGGLVLHQLYNPENPRSLAEAPHFVAFYNPIEIWLGYAREAERRLGRTLSPHEVDAYWRGEAFAYVRRHPAQSLRNAGRKLTEFVAYDEVANNRSMNDERLFSPVLRGLPLPFGWLFALGIPGLFLLWRADRRALVVFAPILLVVVTVAVFFAEDRFRFPAAPMLALGAGWFVDSILVSWRDWNPRRLALAGLPVIAIGAASVWCSRSVPEVPVSWDRVAWGYIRMGQLTEARRVAEAHAAQLPSDSSLQEALAYIAVAQGRTADAIGFYRRAILLRPGSHTAHFNLARLLARNGRREEALREAKIAASLAPDPDYRALVAALGGD